MTHATRRTTLCTLLLATSLSAWAGPGAHGPNGEHLDAPANTAAMASEPSASAQSELFELVARLDHTGLVIDLGRFASNEPVAAARIELELGTLTALASYRPQEGDYLVTAPALLAALRAPGEHALVFTIEAQGESDLLDAVISQASQGPDHDQGQEGARPLSMLHTPGNRKALGLFALLGLSGLAGAVWWRRARRSTHLAHPSHAQDQEAR